MTATPMSEIWSAVRSTYSGRLPDRYSQPYDAVFRDRVRAALRPRMDILDAGGGREPTVPQIERPDGSRYVGLDISRDEMQRAGEGEYDEMIEADVSEPIERLRDRFDLVLSWQVLEHVKPLDAALENLRTYLRPGGRLIAQLSGKFSAFGLINQALPPKAGMWALTHLVGKDPEEVFPAYYHRCWHSALARMLEPWSEWEVVDLHVGAVPYWRFSKVLQSAYVGYEEWAVRSGKKNLASYYVIEAVR